MHMIAPVSDAEAKAEAIEVFQHFSDTQGAVPAWARVMAHRPAILQAFTHVLSVTMGPGLVEQDNKWKMALKVSHINGCKFCVGAAEGMLEKLGVSKEDMAIVAEDISKMKPDEQIAVRYAEAVTTDAVHVSDEIWETLNQYYNEAQIVELTSAIGLFNHINRFNDALGVVPA